MPNYTPDKKLFAARDDQNISFTSMEIKEGEYNESSCPAEPSLIFELFKNAGDAVFIINAALEVIFWNNAAAAMFGFNEEEILGKKIISSIMPSAYSGLFEAEHKRLAADSYSLPINESIELNCVKKGGDLFPAEISVTIQNVRGSVYSTGIIRDISEIKTAEEEIKKYIEELQISRDVIEQHAVEMVELTNKLSESEEKLTQLNADKDKFFSIISHDLRSPFTGLIGFSEILSTESDTLSGEEIKYFSTMISTSVKSVFNLLENLLQWSRLQRGSIELKASNFIIKDVVKQIFNLYTNNAHFKGINLISEMDDDLEVYADMQMVDTVIRNLISNALKYTPNGGSVTVSAAKQSGCTEVRISDTGIGIKEEELEKLFKPGVNIKQSINGEEKGTGLGLILCKDFIEKNGGSIRAESTIGKGTSFIFILPERII